MGIELLTDNEVARLRSLIVSVRNVVIICHVNADGDALGSSLAWAEYLQQQGKSVHVIAPDQYPDFLHWMPGQMSIIRYDKKSDEAKALIQESDLICILDLNVLSRAGAELESILQKADKPTLLIDHHLNPSVKAVQSVSFPKLSSTSEIVFRIIHQLGDYENMTRSMAANIYCGMMTDTGGFTYNSNQPEIYTIISMLLAKGIDKDKIYRNIYHVFSIDRLRLTGYVLYQKLRMLTPLRASYYTLSKEEQRRFHFIKGDAEGLVNMPLQLRNHRLSISLREDSEKPNVIWVSLRSVDDFPCNEMSQRFFNGGGHKNASGGKLFCSLQEAEKIVRDAIQSYASLL
ncbi:MAG: DHH family phosphoesterase [Prevotella sp.]|nr:DHH family phosphoesterase [Prevotella sp.]